MTGYDSISAILTDCVDASCTWIMFTNGNCAESLDWAFARLFIQTSEVTMALAINLDNLNEQIFHRNDLQVIGILIAPPKIPVSFEHIFGVNSCEYNC